MNAAPTFPLSSLEPSVHMVSPCLQAPATWIAFSLFPTRIWPGKTRRAPHSCAPTISPGRREAVALRHEVRAAPSRVRISSGPTPFLGLANLAWRWFSSALAGVWLLSVAMIPVSKVDGDGAGYSGHGCRLMYSGYGPTP